MSTRENTLMNTRELEQEQTTVTLIAPEGLGFGGGGISVKEQIDSGILTQEAPKHIHELLLNDPEAFKSVEADDDGCGDGRPWSKIIQMVADGEQESIRLYKTSLLRAKVFAGGLVTASSMWRTIQGAPSASETAGQDRAFIAAELTAREFSHGAHSDDHATGESCGCGAIDKYEIITANAVSHRAQITSTLEALYGDTYEENQSAIEQAFGVYESISKSREYFADVSGKQPMEQILRSGAVVKELAGHHVEDTIVINDVHGTTLDQPYFTESIKNACVEEKKPETIQAFSVDIWRGREIADLVASIAAEQNPECDTREMSRLAYADFLIRTLAVACTLTAGDLPVYLREAAK